MMTPGLWQRLKPLFHAALKEGTKDRAAFIESACGGDLELKMHLKHFSKPSSKIMARRTLYSAISTIS